MAATSCSISRCSSFIRKVRSRSERRSFFGDFDKLFFGDVLVHRGLHGLYSTLSNLKEEGQDGIPEIIRAVQLVLGF
jgi:hypothetical protein